MLGGRLTAVLLTLTVALPTLADEQEKERLKSDEALLRQTGVGTDGKSLLEFFLVRTAGEKALEDIEALLKPLHDKRPAVRAAAAEAIVRAGKDRERQTARRLLKDADGRVRAVVAVALVERKDREAVGPLIESLADSPPELAWRAEQLLF